MTEAELEDFKKQMPENWVLSDAVVALLLGRVGLADVTFPVDTANTSPRRHHLVISGISYDDKEKP